MNKVLFIKNMVCNRCILAVEQILKDAAISYSHVSLGEVHLNQEPDPEKKLLLNRELKAIGFELIEDHVSALIEKTKQLVIRKARNESSAADRKLNLSTYLQNNLPYEYTYLSGLFSSVEGRTIENYFIEQRIEKVKELLVYDQLTLSEIAFQLHYSSVAHLSSRFKKVTGMTPSYFKSLRSTKRRAVDEV